MIEFFVPQNPQGKKTPVAVRQGGFTKIVKAPKTRAYEESVSNVALGAMGDRPPLEGALRISIRSVILVPASWSKRKRIQAFSGELLPTCKPDCSNVLKSIEDGCNGIVFADDKQIVSALTVKEYGERPGVHVRIWPASETAAALDALDLEELRPELELVA